MYSVATILFLLFYFSFFLFRNTQSVPFHQALTCLSILRTMEMKFLWYFTTLNEVYFNTGRYGDWIRVSFLLAAFPHIIRSFI